MALKCLDGARTSIAAVDVRGDQLELDFSILCHDTLEFGADFVIEDLKINCEALGGQALCDGFVGREAMFVVTTGKYGSEDTVGITMVSNHDVLLPIAGTNRETACIV